MRRAVGADDVQFTLRVADHFAIPSDGRTWGRFIDWLIKHKAQILRSLLPDVLSVFEVWQNLAADIQNPRTEAILTWVEELLSAIEDLRHPEQLRRGESGNPWAEVPGDLSEFETRLRQVFLGAARVRAATAATYLDRLCERSQLGSVVLGKQCINGYLTAAGTRA